MRDPGRETVRIYCVSLAARQLLSSGAVPLLRCRERWRAMLVFCKKLVATLPTSPGHLRVGYVADGKRGRRKKERMQKLPQPNACALMEVQCTCPVQFGNTNLHHVW